MRIARLIMLSVATVVVQVVLFPHLQIAGVVPDLGLVLAVAVGYQRGPESGALAGFAAGVGFDLFLDTPVGLYALVYGLVGYGVGVLQAGMLRTPRSLPVLLGLAGGLAGGLLLIVVGVLIGVDAVKGVHGVETVVLAAGYDALVAPIVFWFVARVLGRPEPAHQAW